MDGSRMQARSARAMAVAMAAAIAAAAAWSCDCGERGIEGDAASDWDSEDAIADEGEGDGDWDAEPDEEPAIGCGDGVLDEGEECDDGAGNSDEEPDACRTTCELPGCGDGVRDTGEECDGEDTGDATCVGMGMGFTGGLIGCTPGCELDVSLCSTCGDGVIGMHEECEGADLGGASCESLGLGGTGLRCTAGCLLDPSACAVCGNGVIEGGEECDDGNWVSWDGCNSCSVAEFVVNDWLYGTSEQPTVAISPGGRMVVAWVANGSPGPYDTEGSHVWARTWGEDGTAMGLMWPASPERAEFPEAEIDWSDRIVMTWQGPVPAFPTWPPTTDRCVYYRMFDLDGTSLDDQFEICLGYSGVEHGYSDVASVMDGSFLVAWNRQYEAGGLPAADVVGQRFDPEGARNGEIFLFQTSGDRGYMPAVGSSPDGRTIVVWMGDDDAAYGTLYDPAGAPMSERFLVTNGPVFRMDDCLAVSMNGSGEFIVVWSQGLVDAGEDLDIYGRSYGADGVPIGSPFMISTSVGISQERVDVGLFPDGRKIVVWETMTGDDVGAGINGQMLDSGNDPLGPEISLSSMTGGDQEYPDLHMDPTGRFAVVWISGSDVYAQRFNADGTAIGTMPW